MNNNAFHEVFRLVRGRKILQANTASLTTNEPAFIALISIIPILTLILIITITIFCCRYYSYRKTKRQGQYKHGNIFERNLSIRNYQQPIIPVSMTPTSGSAYSVRSTEQLFSHRYEKDQTPSGDRLPSRRLQQSMIDAYLDDLHSFQPSQINVEKLNSYLFVDLHSTSSETLPDTMSKVFSDNTTINFNESTYDETQRQYHEHLKQQRNRLSVKSKQPYNSRFIMRERSLPNNLRQLPQLRRRSSERQNDKFGKVYVNDSSSSTTNTQDLQSTHTSNESNEYENVHNINSNPITQTVEVKNPIINSPLHIQHSVAPPLHYHYNQPHYYFEKVSTSNVDDSDIEVPCGTFPILSKRNIYTNDTIIL